MSEWLSAPVSEESCARVRGGVLGRIRRRRIVQRSAAGAALLVMLSLLPFAVPREVEQLALSMPVPPAAPEVHLMAVVPPTVLKPRAARPVPDAAEKITIFTDDPDVVIVLVGGGGE